MHVAILTKIINHDLQMARWVTGQYTAGFLNLSGWSTPAGLKKIFKYHWRIGRESLNTHGQLCWGEGLSLCGQLGIGWPVQTISDKSCGPSWPAQTRREPQATGPSWLAFCHAGQLELCWPLVVSMVSFLTTCQAGRLKLPLRASWSAPSPSWHTTLYCFVKTVCLYARFSPVKRQGESRRYK